MLITHSGSRRISKNHIFQQKTLLANLMKARGLLHVSCEFVLIFL